MLRYTGPRNRGFDTRQRQAIFYSTQPSDPPPPFIQRLMEAVTPSTKVTTHLHLSKGSKNEWIYTRTFTSSLPCEVCKVYSLPHVNKLHTPDGMSEHASWPTIFDTLQPLLTFLRPIPFHSFPHKPLHKFQQLSYHLNAKFWIHNFVIVSFTL